MINPRLHTLSLYVLKLNRVLFVFGLSGKIGTSVYVFGGDECCVGGKERAAADNRAVCGGGCVVQQVRGGVGVEVLKISG